MRIINTSWKFEEEFNGMDLLRKIEKAGRTCYKSENKVTENSMFKFVNMICHQYKHYSVLEHASVTVRVFCDRGISHEIVRHRIGAYSQESTRYCNYCKDKFDKEITVVFPEHLFYKPDKDLLIWKNAMEDAEMYYFKLIALGWTAQEARGVLPTELKTELVITYNLRQWRHFFTMRCDKPAHPQMRALTLPMLETFKKKIPIVFDDLVFEEIKKSL